jgi:hypothetical protein
MSVFEASLYLSFLKPRGKVILDIGAWKGDSAFLFLRNGARKVLAVEKDPELAKQIPRDDRIIVLNEPANPDHIASPLWDACKIDIEGYELGLLDSLRDETRPVLLESHNWYITDKFLEIGFTYLAQPKHEWSMLGLCHLGKNAN